MGFGRRATSTCRSSKKKEPAVWQQSLANSCWVSPEVWQHCHRTANYCRQNLRRGNCAYSDPQPPRYARTGLRGQPGVRVNVLFICVCVCVGRSRLCCKVKLHDVIIIWCVVFLGMPLSSCNIFTCGGFSKIPVCLCVCVRVVFHSSSCLRRRSST